ncbi:hypothetical protein Lepil_0381 [Leptonema illini DSM 21528]|uniref:Uncharacterized protein n=1 Tax=Leptonema illini DSM 21528 TaxID=929563 RepID=H2CKN2_9LEPT|nr:hypothetical protein Lepil_0381 [Leptonema illini DSM 21528]
MPPTVGLLRRGTPRYKRRQREQQKGQSAGPLFAAAIPGAGFVWRIYWRYQRVVPNRKRVIAQIEAVFSNNMSEAGNKTMKYEYLFPQKPYFYGHVIRILEKTLSLTVGLTDSSTVFLPTTFSWERCPMNGSIEQARANRPEINRNQVYGFC